MSVKTYEPMIDDRVRVNSEHAHLQNKVGTIVALALPCGYYKVQIDGLYSWVAIHKKDLEKIEHE